MRIDIMTLFPDAVEAMMGSSIIGRARERGFVTIQTHQIRDYTTNKQMQVDDYPYGGGRGAVMQADPLYRCWQHICDEAGERVHTIYMSPCGRVLTQQMALCAQNFELLPILKDTPEGQLLHNTIYAGVWSKYALVKATRTPRKGKTNE